MTTISETIVEIRYKANPKVLDRRGSWASSIAAHIGLEQWRITENRIDIFDKDTKQQAFVGFRNAGYVIKDASTKNYFSDKATKFFKHLGSLTDFDNPLHVERIGVRSKFLTPYQKSFDDLRDALSSKYAPLTDEAKKIVSAKLVDVGFAFNFVDSQGNFNTTCGPMEQSQALQFLSHLKKDTAPKIGLFFDIDYWLKPNKEKTIDELSISIKDFSESAWDKNESLKKLVID